MTRRTLSEALVQEHTVPSLFDALAGGGQTSHRHPQVSGDAAERDQTGSRLSVLEAVRAAGEWGITSKELVEEGCAPNVQLAGARLIELRGGKRRSATDPDARYPRLVARLVMDRVGYHQRDGAIVHVAIECKDMLLPIFTLEDETTPAVCRCCGQTIKPRVPR